jgi:hypothetical protein
VETTIHHHLAAVGGTKAIVKNVGISDLQNLYCRLTVLGGAGYKFATGDLVSLSFGPLSLIVKSTDDNKTERISFFEVAEFNITGPGAVGRGGGFIGGGFGVEAAVEGMAIAGILNGLTAQTEIHTFITLVTHVGELHLHYSGMEPGALRVALSRIFAILRRLNPNWMKSRLERLQALLEEKIISNDEFEQLKERLSPAVKSGHEPLPSCCHSLHMEQPFICNGR